MKPERSGIVRRRMRGLAFLVVFALLGGTYVNVWGINLYKTILYDQLIQTPAYEAKYGHWDMVNIPDSNKINAIHSIMLATGKVLLMAGSGNNQANFDAGTFKSLIYDPATGASHLIHTPADMFCSGHAHLPNGDILIAGGTLNYEILKANMTHAGGTITIANSDPKHSLTIKKGTVIVGQKSGKSYKLDSTILIPKATYSKQMAMVMPSSRNAYAAAVKAGKSGIYNKQDTYVPLGLATSKPSTFTITAPAMNTDQKQYEGSTSSYIFDPWKEKYIKVNPLNYARWYPTLMSMTGGNVMAISGLDQGGRILDGQIEVYDVKTGNWVERPDLFRFFPTYPSIFQTAKPNVLFSAGPSTGYGPATKGRTPGFWYLNGNTFKPVTGLRDPGLLETGSATWLGPVNDQRLVVVGGGGVGDTNTATSRIDSIDLSGDNPSFTPVANLQDKTRYPNLVTLPNGNLFITNGSTEYRGRNESDILKSYMLSDKTGTLTRMANPEVGRDYHASALLLPNGQVLVAGGDPLFSDKADTKPGKFEQRIEIYSPPYLFTKTGKPVDRPALASNGFPASLADGETTTLTIKDHASKIASASLVYPGAVTHMTDTNQRLIDLNARQNGNKITITVPKNPSLVLPGDYMLFLVDSKGVPSNAVWVAVGPKGQVTPMTSMN